MRKVKLRMKELNKYEVIKELVDHNGNKIRAKEKLQKEKKLENKTEEEIEVVVNNEVALEDSHPRGEKPKYFKFQGVHTLVFVIFTFKFSLFSINFVIASFHAPLLVYALQVAIEFATNTPLGTSTLDL